MGFGGTDAGGQGGTAGAAGAKDSGPDDGVLVLAGGRDCPSDLRVAAGSVTWVNQGSLQQSAQDGVVATMPTTGCGADAGSCIVTLAADQPSPAAVELSGTTVFWSTISDDGIWSLPQGTSSPLPFATGQDFPRSLAVDDTALYWVNAGQLGSGNGDIHRAWLDTPGGLPVVTGLDSPVALTVFGSTVFWTSYGVNDTDGRVMSADVTGGATTDIALYQSQPRGIRVSPAYVYWANSGDGTLMRATPDASEVKKLVNGLATPSNVAVDADHVYWVEAGTPNVYADGSVKAANLDGTNVVTLAKDQLDPRRIALDPEHVYWINRGTQGLSPCTQHDGQVMRAPKPL